jgi:hypothetical protein
MLFIGVFLSVEMWHGKLGKNVGRGRVKSHIKLSSPSRSLHHMRTYVLLPRAVRWRSVQVWNHLIDFLPTNYPTRSAFNRVSCPSIFNSVSTQSWLTCPNSVHRTVHVPVFRPVFLMGSDTHGSLSPYHRPGYRAPRRSSPISTYSTLLYIEGNRISFGRDSKFSNYSESKRPEIQSYAHSRQTSNC